MFHHIASFIGQASASVPCQYEGALGAKDPILMGSMMNSFPIFSAIAMPRVVPQLSHRCYSRSARAHSW